jgi:hypothetical protein
LITEGVFTSGVNTCVQSAKSATQNVSIPALFSSFAEVSFISLAVENSLTGSDRVTLLA